MNLTTARESVAVTVEMDESQSAAILYVEAIENPCVACSSAELTPVEARQLAAALTALADEIEGRAA